MRRGNEREGGGEDDEMMRGRLEENERRLRFSPRIHHMRGADTDRAGQRFLRPFPVLLCDVTVRRRFL